MIRMVIKHKGKSFLVNPNDMVCMKGFGNKDRYCILDGDPYFDHHCVPIEVEKVCLVNIRYRKDHGNT